MTETRNSLAGPVSLTSHREEERDSSLPIPSDLLRLPLSREQSYVNSNYDLPPGHAKRGNSNSLVLSSQTHCDNYQNLIIITHYSSLSHKTPLCPHAIICFGGKYSSQSSVNSSLISCHRAMMMTRRVKTRRDRNPHHLLLCWTNNGSYTFQFRDFRPATGPSIYSTSALHLAAGFVPESFVYPTQIVIIIISCTSLLRLFFYSNSPAKHRQNSLQKPAYFHLFGVFVRD